MQALIRGVAVKDILDQAHVTLQPTQMIKLQNISTYDQLSYSLIFVLISTSSHQVNLHKGLFYFDSRFRPVPLKQTFIGVRGTNKFKTRENIDLACYEKVLESVKSGNQVRVIAANIFSRSLTPL